MASRLRHYKLRAQREIVRDKSNLNARRKSIRLHRLAKHVVYELITLRADTNVAIHQRLYSGVHLLCICTINTI